MEQEKVFCIIVTYNGMEWIKRCLDSLISSSYKNRIIIVDNNSTDNTVTYIKENYPQVELKQTGKNLGFGQGNNIGLTTAIRNNADFVFLLNQDAFVEVDTISNLVKAQLENPGYGILSPVHMNGEGDDFDSYFYRYLIESDIKSLVRSALLEKGAPGNIIDTSFVNAAAWLVSKECVLNTGGFDPRFFHYGEDVNYAQRALFKGFKIGIATTAIIYHCRKREEWKNVKTKTIDLKKDKILFLNQACDPHQPAYKILIAKRFLRYFSFTMLNFILLNKEGVHYNFLMAKHVAFSFKDIKRSRNISINNGTPYLEINQ